MQVHVNIRDLLKGSVIADDLMSDTDKLHMLYAVSERMQELYKRYCPYDKWNLRKSLSVVNTPTGTIHSYSAPYAVYVHEIMTNYHKRPTRAKWITAALSQALKELILEFGNENIPSFHVVFSTKPTLQIELTLEHMGLNWRDLV